MKKLIMILCLLLSCQVLWAEEEYVSGKVLTLHDIKSAEEEEIREILDFHVELTSGDRKGEVVQVDYPVYHHEEYNVEVGVGDKVVLYHEVSDEGRDLYFISDRDKRSYLGGLALLFVVLTLLIAGKQGIKAILSLGVTVLGIFYYFLPKIISGGSPILYAVITAGFSSVISIFCMTGWKKKGWTALAGSLGGVLSSGLLSYLAVHKMGLTGYETAESLSFAPFLTEIKLKEVISAGIILGSLGAVMDVAMSIASSMQEILEQKKDVTAKQLFSSALQIGRDIIGTMVNTLILAYLGSSLLMTIMISIQKEDFPWIRLLNFENISIEILRSLAGSVGILVAVPLTAIVGCTLYLQKSKIEAEK